MKKFLLLPVILAVGLGILMLISTEPPKSDADADGEIHQAEGGLQYIDLVVGTGAEAKPGDHVVVHYTGWLKLNKKRFDSSYDAGKPFEFQIGAGRVIKGWDIGVAGMKIGGTRKLIIPSELGYGPRGTGGSIPPNADLLFKVELLDVK